jgi:hypothetical protein
MATWVPLMSDGPGPSADRPRATTRSARLAVVRDADNVVLFAGPTFETDADGFLDLCRDWLVQERHHSTFRPTNTAVGMFEELSGDLGPMRDAMRAGAPLTVELVDHHGWGPAADAARDVQDALAVWTGANVWGGHNPAKAPLATAKRHTTCPACGASPSRAGIRERLCDVCGADLPRPGRR